MTEYSATRAYRPVPTLKVSTNSRIWYSFRHRERLPTSMISKEPGPAALDGALRGFFPLILTLDTHGVPHRWITWQHACYYYAKNQIAWTLGGRAFPVYGGLNRV